MKISVQTMRLIHRAHLQYDVKKIDLITWSSIITGGDQSYCDVSETNHIYDRIYGVSYKDFYLNKLHIGIFGMRVSFARNIGYEGTPMDLLDPYNAVHYFSRFMAQIKTIPLEKQIRYMAGCVIFPKNFDVKQFRYERSKLQKLQLVE